jgi:very-short-patch-repair endonuclease
VKSFDNHSKKIYWSNKNELTPRQVFKSSGKKYIFECVCKHDFEISLYQITSRNCWCPYCCNPPKKLCENENCKECFEKSFKSHPKSIYWMDDKNNKKSRQVFKQSNFKYWFNCNDCNHIFDTTLGHILEGNWCPYCNSYKLCEKENCKQCFDKSFASHPKIKYWSDKNEKNPRQICLYSDIKCYFICIDCNNIFYTMVKIISKGSWCPLCKNKTEKKVIEFLKKNNINFIYQFKLTNDTKLYDILCIDTNIIIEIDGRQHFEDVKTFKSNKNDIQDNDKNKMINAINEGYSFIRIYQPDIWNDKIDWKNIILKNLIKNIKPVILYYSADSNIYKDYNI